MRFLKLIVAYDGTHFSGWQWQPDRRTAQGELETAIRKVTGEVLRVVASGRTDAGVHALGQSVSFATECRLAPDVFTRALNANLPEDLVVREAAQVRAGFNAIDDAVSKRYRYLIHDAPQRDVFSRRYAWHLHYRLDVAAMDLAARSLLGRQDFKSFESSGSARVSTVRTVHAIELRRIEAWNTACIRLEIEADGFLYNMVRNIVGTLVQIGRGKQPVSWLGEVLAQKDRRTAGPTAPPQGLYLLKVNFRDDEPQMRAASCL